MNAEITTREFMELVTESCKFRILKEYVESCQTCLDDDVVRAILGVTRKDEKDV